MIKFLSLLFVPFFFLASPSLWAAPSAAVATHLNFVAPNLGSVSWYPVVTSLTKGIKGVSIFNSASLPIEIGISTGGAAADAEVTQVIVPAALSAAGAPGAIFYPMVVGYGNRVSIRALSSTGATLNSGVVDMTLFYN